MDEDEEGIGDADEEEESWRWRGVGGEESTMEKMEGVNRRLKRVGEVRADEEVRRDVMSMMR